MKDVIVGYAQAYFIIRQFVDEEGDCDAEVLERLSTASEHEPDGAFDDFDIELIPHNFDDRQSVVKVESRLVKSYVHDYDVYEYDFEFTIRELDFNKFKVG